jgi:alpha-beta hydrolase superfamily lysophospholipase
VTIGYREGTGVGAQGIQLYWRIWEAANPMASLLLVHGLGEHSGRYRSFAEALAEAGTSVFAFDLRGHGKSPGPRGDVDAFPRLLEDLLGMEDEMSRQLPAKGPRFLMGHSLGGLISIRRLQVFKGPFSGAVLSAPWLATAQPSWLRSVARVLGLALPTVPLPAGIHPARLSRDPDVVLAWRKDPLIHTKISGRFFREADREQSKALVSGWPKDTPALFLVPGADRVVRTPVTLAFSRTIVGEDIQVEILEGREHEPLNDIGREEVYRLVLDWLANQVEGKPDPIQASGDLP